MQEGAESALREKVGEREDTEQELGRRGQEVERLRRETGRLEEEIGALEEQIGVLEERRREARALQGHCVERR